MERSYKIAGLTVNLEYRTGELSVTYPYEVEYTSQPDMTLELDYSQLDFDSINTNFYPPSAKKFMEHTAMASAFYDKLPDFDGLLIHSSAIVMDGKAYLFTADSGTGKSTHTSLYRRVFGDERVRILNDDKPAVRYEDGQFFAYGTPWSGKTRLNLNLRVPLGGVCVLRRGEVNEIRRMKPRESVFALLGQTIRPNDPQQMEKLMNLMEKLVVQIPVWEMHCNMDPEAAKVSYAALSGKGKEE